MPRLNHVGQACTGVTNYSIGVDGAVPAPLSGITGGGVEWYLVDRLVYQDTTGGANVLRITNLTTGGTSTPDGLGASVIRAGGGVYGAAILPGGVRSSVSGLGPFPAANLAAVSEAGETLIITDYQAGQGLELYNLVGQRIVDINPTLGAVNPWVRKGVISYVDGAGAQLYRVASRAAIPFTRRSGLYWFVPVPMADGSIWLLEADTVGPINRLSLRNAQAATGYTLAYGVDTFYADAIELTAGLVRVVWSTGIADLPTELVRADVTVATGAWSRATVSGGALVPQVQPPLAPATLPNGTASPVTLGGRPGVRKSAAPVRRAGGQLEGVLTTDPAGRPTIVPFPTSNGGSFVLGGNRAFIPAGVSLTDLQALLVNYQVRMVYDDVLGAYILPRP